MLLLEIFLREISVGSVVLLQEVSEYLVIGVVALLLRQCLMVDLVAGLIEFVLDLLAQVFVVDLIVVLALLVSTEFFCQLVLELAHRLDSGVSSLEGVDEVFLLNLFHLALHHHDVVLGGSDHQVHVGVGHLLEGGVDDVLAVDAGHANLRDCIVKRNVRASHSCGCGKTCQCIGLIHAVGGKQHHLHIHLAVIVRREERAQGTVYQTRDEDLLIAGFTLTLSESARETACSTVLLTIVYLQRHEICSRNCLFGCANGSKQHGVAHTQDSSAIGLLRNLSGFN